MSAVLVNTQGPHSAIIDLTAEMNSVVAADHGGSGRIAHPVVSLPGLRVLIVSMKSGAHWAEHATPGRITVQPLSGHLRLRWQDQVAELAPGRVAALASNVVHDVWADTDAAFLLTVARPQAD